MMSSRSVVVLLALMAIVGSCMAVGLKRGPVANFKMTKMDFTQDNNLQELYKFTSSHNRIKALLDDAPPPGIHDVPAGGSISLLPTGAYFVEVFVGTPAQPVLALIDSGSNDFLVTTSGCQGCNKPQDTEYNFSNSSTVSKVACSTLDNKCLCSQDVCSFKNVYVTCAPNNPDQICILEGPVLNDVFSIPSTGLSVSVNFGAITFMNITFPGPISAIWGVAANSNYTAFGEVGPLEALAQSGQIADIFSICILQENGTFTLGGADDSLYTGSLSYVPILSESAFLIETVDIQIDGVSLGLNSSVYNMQLNASVLDTGTYSIVLPDVAFNAISEVLTNMCNEVPLVGVCDVPPAQNIFNGTCYNMTSQDVDLFPSFTVVLNGTSLTIGGENYLVPNITSPECMTWGIQNGGPGSLTIHGDVLMKGLYTVFDKENMQIGFAPANVTACASSPSVPL